MNTPHTGITYSQRNGLRRYRENQRAIRYVAPMHRRAVDVPPPAPLSLRHRIRAEIAAGKRVWKQIAAEVTAAPIHMKVTVAVFFGAGALAWIALFCGWLK